MKKILSGLFWKFSERILAQLVTLLVSIVLARLLSPDDYGLIALVTVFITLANVFVIHGFGSALVQKKDADNIDFSSVFYANIAFSIFLYFLLYIFAPLISEFYNNDIICPVVRVLGLRVPIAAVNSIQQAYVSKHMIFKKSFYSALLGAILSGIVGCSMAYMGYGIWALVGQYLTNSIVDTIVLWFTVKWRPNLVFSFKKVKSLLSYAWKLLASALLDTGYTQLRSLIIGKKYSTSDLAYYNQGQQYPQILVVNINTAISSVLFPVISKYQNDLTVVKKFTRRAIAISSYIMWPMMIGLCIVAEPLISIILTDKWLPCVPYLQIWCISYAFWPIHTANLEAIKAIGRSDIFLKLEIVKKIFGISLLLLTMNYGVMAIALSLIVSTIVSCFINSFPNKDLLNYGFKDQVIDMLPSLLISCLMAIVVYPLKWIISNSFILLVTQVLWGITSYILFSKLFKINSFEYLLNILIDMFLKKNKNV